MALSDLELLQLAEAAREGRRGDKGEPGTGIRSIEQSQDDGFVINLTDGKSIPIKLPPAQRGDPGPEGMRGERGQRGEQGRSGRNGVGIDGRPGDPGNDGIGIDSAVVNSTGELLIGLTDGNLLRLGKVVGPPGRTGDPGPAGLPGDSGADGKTILSGQGAPGDSLGSQGDFYLDLLSPTVDLYGPKTEGGWGLNKVALRNGFSERLRSEGQMNAGGWSGPTTSTGSGVSSWNSRSGVVNPEEGDYSLDMLSDVTVIDAEVGDFLQFNSNGEWANTPQVPTPVIIKGAVDVTAPIPVGYTPVPGDVWINTTTGNVGAGWVGIEGDAITVQQFVIFGTATGSGEWSIGGAIALLDNYLPLTGGTIGTTGNNAAQTNGNLIVKSDASDNGGRISTADQFNKTGVKLYPGGSVEMTGRINMIGEAATQQIRLSGSSSSKKLDFAFEPTPQAGTFNTLVRFEPAQSTFFSQSLILKSTGNLSSNFVLQASSGAVTAGWEADTGRIQAGSLIKLDGSDGDTSGYAAIRAYGNTEARLELQTASSSTGASGSTGLSIDNTNINFERGTVKWDRTGTFKYIDWSGSNDVTPPAIQFRSSHDFGSTYQNVLSLQRPLARFYYSVQVDNDLKFSDNDPHYIGWDATSQPDSALRFVGSVDAAGMLTNDRKFFEIKKEQNTSFLPLYINNSSNSLGLRFNGNGTNVAWIDAFGGSSDKRIVFRCGTNEADLAEALSIGRNSTTCTGTVNINGTSGGVNAVLQFGGANSAYINFGGNGSSYIYDGETDNPDNLVASIGTDLVQCWRRFQFETDKAPGVTGSGFTIRGYTAQSTGIPTNLFVQVATGSGDAIRYYGEISNGNDIVTKSYADSLSSLAGGVVLHDSTTPPTSKDRGTLLMTSSNQLYIYT